MQELVRKTLDEHQQVVTAMAALEDTIVQAGGSVPLRSPPEIAFTSVAMGVQRPTRSTSLQS